MVSCFRCKIGVIILKITLNSRQMWRSPAKLLMMVWILMLQKKNCFMNLKLTNDLTRVKALVSYNLLMVFCIWVRWDNQCRRVFDILKFSFYSYTSLRQKFLVMLSCNGILHINLRFFCPYVMSASDGIMISFLFMIS